MVFESARRAFRQTGSTIQSISSSSASPKRSYGIALFTVKDGKLTVHFIGNENPDYNLSFTTSDDADIFRGIRCGDVKWNGTSSSFQAVLVSGTMLESTLGAANPGTCCHFLEYGVDLQASSLGRLPVTSQNEPRYCSIAFVDDQILIAGDGFIKADDVNPNHGQNLASNPGYCLQLRDLRKVRDSTCQLPHDGQYSDQYGYQPFRTTPVMLRSNVGPSKAPGNFLYLERGSKVFGVSYNDTGNWNSIALWSMPIHHFRRQSRDSIWSKLTLFADGKKCVPACSIAIQGRDFRSPPRLYFFCFDGTGDKAEIWFGHLRLRALGCGVHGDPDVPPGQTQAVLSDVQTLAEAGVHSDEKTMARALPMKAVIRNHVLSILYTSEDSLIFHISTSINDDGTLSRDWTRDNVVGSGGGKMIGACVVPTSILPLDHDVETNMKA